MYRARTKHIEIDVYYVSEKVLRNQLEIRYIPTFEQTRDIFTKLLGTTRFFFLRSKLSAVQVLTRVV